MRFSYRSFHINLGIYYDWICLCEERRLCRLCCSFALWQSAILYRCRRYILLGRVGAGLIMNCVHCVVTYRRTDGRIKLSTQYTGLAFDCIKITPPYQTFWCLPFYMWRGVQHLSWNSSACEVTDSVMDDKASVQFRTTSWLALGFTQHNNICACKVIGRWPLTFV